MSLGIYPVFRPGISEAKPSTLGYALAREYEALDRIADAHRLRRFTAFTDNRTVPKGFSGPPEELQELLGPWDEWFEPAEGKNALQALVDVITNDPTAEKELEEPSAVINELEDLVRTLHVAQTRGAAFRLEMG